MKDCHIHTNISHDGISSIEEYLKYGYAIGVDEITFTEHYDDYTGMETKIEKLNITDYYNKYLLYKDNGKVKTNFGVEISLRPDLVNKIENEVNHYHFDFIIGSSHMIRNKDIGLDKSSFDGYSREEAYLIYFKETLQNIILYNQFDVYGHLDYIVRYGNYSSKKIEYSEFKEILDEILISLIKKDKGIELNTSGFRYGLGNPHPNIDIIKRYKELGGKIITVGSDAHKTEDLAKNFNEAFNILESIGYEEIAVYHNRIPDFIKIKELRK